jgi:hypothetical protein
MTAQTSAAHELVATIDVRDLSSSRWGFIRPMFPSFVEDIELGRYLRTLLNTSHYAAVRVEPHRGLDGRLSTHVVDVYRLDDTQAGPT